MSERRTKRYASEELKRLRARGQSRSDWKRVRRLTDGELRRAVAEDADTFVPGPEWWESARVVLPPRDGKRLLSLRLDRDVIEWFKAQGPGYQSRINAVLRSYVEARRKQTERDKGRGKMR